MFEINSKLARLCYKNLCHEKHIDTFRLDEWDT